VRIGLVWCRAGVKDGVVTRWGFFWAAGLADGGRRTGPVSTRLAQTVHLFTPLVTVGRSALVACILPDGTGRGQGRTHILGLSWRHSRGPNCYILAPEVSKPLRCPLRSGNEAHIDCRMCRRGIGPGGVIRGRRNDVAENRVIEAGRAPAGAPPGLHGMTRTERPSRSEEKEKGTTAASRRLEGAHRRGRVGDC